ncbi:pyrroline-5-carboxylate reductase [Polaribacter reichenbachii]|uniref:Pyrroline-5-carboxylate reductase n=1 Tax=Polaribacter reichenbachii TaxID=996801 RepID=A0A1B8U063_9FLAO|nr:pyrroline-5-carboxylate reductase [Polaribacter reichenbachii]APZ47075.1 pyrroline-5-carboxylate reductase [Polaribacter reichenbachii]AUC17716.1 pyrroline-5-carboxylate reductase [Polaribacter reichenbachii]OBY65261.1 pyrroline-5-carboxylate reductase [Polaribacter reichenbachii]
MKVAIIGAGSLGQSIAKGLLKSKAVETLYLTKRNIDSLNDFNVYNEVILTSDNKKAVKNADVLIFAVQPRHFDRILENIKPLITENHVIISVITGFSIDKIEAIVGHNKNIIRSMPNTAASVGQSMTCISANTKGKEKVSIAKTIFNSLGTSLEIPEEQLQAATVICASGIAFWMRLIRATTQGAIQLGFEPDEAHKLAMQTCFGAATLLKESGKHPEAEIDRVTTPGGCTIEGLNEMEHQGLSSSLIKGINASFEKINQIKK